jgi:hypothetical protein
VLPAAPTLPAFPVLPVLLVEPPLPVLLVEPPLPVLVPDVLVLYDPHARATAPSDTGTDKSTTGTTERIFFMATSPVAWVARYGPGGWWLRDE